MDRNGAIDRNKSDRTEAGAENVDLDQIVERLAWTPAEHLRYLLHMLAFEEKARQAKPLKR